MKSKRIVCREGFTLVELLIVIVVIGVLSAMMMLSSTEAVSSAKAANIINNLRNLKTAVLSWYMDHMEELKIDSDYHFQGTTKVGNNTYKDSKNIHNFAANNPEGRKAILKYLNNENIQLNVDGNSWLGDHYRVFDGTANNIAKNSSGSEWFIGYKVPDSDKRLMQKLVSRSQTAGLICYENSSEVWLKILDLSE